MSRSRNGPPVDDGLKLFRRDHLVNDPLGVGRDTEEAANLTRD